MKSTAKTALVTTLALGTLAVAGLAGFGYSGSYNIGADDAHTALVSSALETVRERSIRVHASGLQPPPDLDDRTRIVAGAGNYAAMCASCHLAPGVSSSELSVGLYPTPPNLTRVSTKTEEAFWVIKHGIKASGMPAWGRSMDDDSVWNLAAFLKVLPTLDDAAYDQLVASSGGHSHGGSGGHDDAAADEHGDSHSHADEAAHAHGSEHPMPMADAGGPAVGDSHHESASAATDEGHHGEVTRDKPAQAHDNADGHHHGGSPTKLNKGV